MMNRQTLAALIVLNVVLLAALAVVGFSPAPAQAQMGFAQQQYIMVSGRAVGRDQQAAVYVIELSTARVVALFFNSANNRIEILGGREMAADMGLQR